MPATLNAGDTWQWTVAPADFPPGQGYTLSYQLTGKTAISFVPAPNVPNGNYSVLVPAATTAVVGPGRYRWVLRVTDIAGVVTTINSGHLVINANTAVTAGADGRSHAEQMVALIESELQARIKGDGSANLSYSIEGRSITKIPTTELYQLRSKYRGEVSRQTNGGRGVPVKLAFGRRRCDEWS